MTRWCGARWPSKAIDAPAACAEDQTTAPAIIEPATDGDMPGPEQEDEEAARKVREEEVEKQRTHGNQVPKIEVEEAEDERGERA
jgi:hypothetical protein